MRKLKEVLATALESLKKPRVIKEESSRPAGLLKFAFRYNDQLFDVTVYCNEIVYSCRYTGLFRYVRKFCVYEVYSVIAGKPLSHEIAHVFDMTIFFPAFGNMLCSSRQQAAVAIDAYVSIITQRFKNYLKSDLSTA